MRRWFVVFALGGVAFGSFGCSGSGSSSVSGGYDTAEGGTAPSDSEDAGGARDRGTGTDEPVEAGVTPKRVFFTRATFSGDLTSAAGGVAGDGLDGADHLCEAAARNAGMSGQWRAWLSDYLHDARTRIIDVAPWYLVDGKTLVFPTKDALSLTPVHPIDRDEMGAEVDPETPDWVWTSTSTGGATTKVECDYWTQQTSEYSGSVGDLKSSANWTADTAIPQIKCSMRAHLYCFEQ